MEKELYKLFPACTIKDNTLICVTDCEHIFETIDINSGKIEYLDDPEGFDFQGWSGTDSILIYGERLFLLEQNGEHLMEYVPSENRAQYINLKCNDFVCSNFAGATIYNNKIYIFPRFRNSIFKIDFNGVVIEEKLCQKLSYSFNQKEELPHMLFSCSYQIENHIWIFTENDRLILDYDLNQEKFQEYMLPKVIGSCIQAVYEDRSFYILNSEGKVYLWSLEQKREQLLYDPGQEKEYPYYRTIIIAGGKLWILPFLGEHIMVINLKTQDCKKYNDYPSDFHYNAPDNWSKYNTYCDDQRCFYFAMHSGNYILVIDKENGLEHWIKPHEDSFTKKIFIYSRRKKIIPEYVVGEIKDYLDFLKEEKYIEEKNQRFYNGEFIWNSLGGK